MIKYPYTDFHEMNLDWVLSEMKNLGIKVENINTTIADYIQGLIDSGELENIIDTVLLNTKISVYDTFADIPADLEEGELAYTKGFYAIGDGGTALYQVKTGAYPDNMEIIGKVTTHKCGIFGDGVTDNTVELQDMFDYYNDIDLLSDHYVITSSVTIRSNQKISGVDAYISLPAGISVPVFAGAALENVTISGIHFTGSISPGSAYYLMTLTASEHVEIHHCTFYNGYGYSIRFSGNKYSAIHDCEFSNITGTSGNPGGCVYMQGGENCEFFNLYAENIQDHVIYLDGSVTIDNIKVKNCVSDTILNALTNAACVVCYGDCNDIIIDGCISKSGVIGFQIATRDSVDPHNITFINCSAYDDTQDGFHIEGSNTGNNNIRLINCSVYRSGQDAFSIRNYPETLITGAKVQTATRYGIAFSSSPYCVLENSKIDGCNIGLAFGYPNTSDNSTAQNIKATNCSGYVYYARGTSAGNRFINCVNPTNGAISYGNSIIINGDDAKSIIYGANAPTSGYHNVGDLCIDSTGASTGWRCSVAGAPGTWVAI